MTDIIVASRILYNKALGNKEYGVIIHNTISHAVREKVKKEEQNLYKANFNITLLLGHCNDNMNTSLPKVLIIFKMKFCKIFFSLFVVNFSFSVSVCLSVFLSFCLSNLFL